MISGWDIDELPTLDQETEGLVLHAEVSGRRRDNVEPPLVASSPSMTPRRTRAELSTPADVLGDDGGRPPPTELQSRIAALLSPPP